MRRRVRVGRGLAGHALEEAAQGLQVVPLVRRRVPPLAQPTKQVGLVQVVVDLQVQRALHPVQAAGGGPGVAGLVVPPGGDDLLVGVDVLGDRQQSPAVAAAICKVLDGDGSQFFDEYVPNQYIYDLLIYVAES